MHGVQVIFDSEAPKVKSMQVAVAPTADSPFFQVAITFTEPVSWRANTTTSTTTANDTVALASAQADSSGNMATGIATYSSSRLLLTNAALLNISMVTGSAAVLASGAATNAGSAFVLWFMSWSGARAAVEVLGAAYQDIAGNRGDSDTALQVRKPGSDSMLQNTHTHAHTQVHKNRHTFARTHRMACRNTLTAVLVNSHNELYVMVLIMPH